MNWEQDISWESQETMRFLGNFGPTVHAHNKEIKGYMLDSFGDGGCKVYLTSRELREISLAFNEVADWLDKRAEKDCEQNSTKSN